MKICGKEVIYLQDEPTYYIVPPVEGIQSRPFPFSSVEPKLVPEILSYYTTAFRRAYQVRSGLNVQHTTEQKRLPNLKN
jgi:hypothetical protein